MLANRLLPLLALIAALLVPAPALAQPAGATIPVAVAARDGSWQPAGDTGCELIWDRAGTPTLRVRASSGDRVREDLVGGEQMEVPEAGPGTWCVFQIELSTADARDYTFSLEGAELATVDAADIDALGGTLVLPVTMDDNGDYALATDSYLDLPLGDTIPRPSVPTEPDATPTATDEVIIASPTPAATPGIAMPAGTPVSADIAGRLVDVELQLFVPDAMAAEADGGCRINASESASVLNVEASTGRYRSELTLQTAGVPVTPSESPTGEAGCLFTFPLHLPAADVYTFRYQDATLAEIPFTDMTAASEPFLLAIGAEGVLTPEPVAPIATPLATPMATPSSARSDQLADGQHTVVGRLNLWTNGEDDAPFGCAAGPYRSGVYPGAQVVVRDESGAIIAYTELRFSDRSGPTVCAFDFTVTVPEAAFYSFELGNGDTVVRSQQDLELWNWRLFIDTGGR